MLIVASNNYGSFAKEQGDTGCGHLCHGPHFVGVGRKQRLHPVELLIILPVVLRIFFFLSHHIMISLETPEQNPIACGSLSHQ